MFRWVFNSIKSNEAAAQVKCDSRGTAGRPKSAGWAHPSLAWMHQRGVKTFSLGWCSHVKRASNRDKSMPCYLLCEKGINKSAEVLSTG